MTARMRDGAKDGDKSFSKLFDIIEEIAASRSGLRGREVAERTGMPVSTTFRMLKFLVENGYLRSASSTYTLGLGIARLGNIAAAQNPLLKISRPILAELSARTMETVHLAELKDGQLLYVDKVEGVRSVRMGSLIGSCSPLHCTGIGKAILAFLDEKTLHEQLETIEWTRYTDTTLLSASALLRDLAVKRAHGQVIDAHRRDRPRLFLRRKEHFPLSAEIGRGERGKGVYQAVHPPCLRDLPGLGQDLPVRPVQAVKHAERDHILPRKAGVLCHDLHRPSLVQRDAQLGCAPLRLAHAIESLPAI